MVAAMDPAIPLLVTGAAGRIGRALRVLWAEGDGIGHPLLWHRREPGQTFDIAWNIGKKLAPPLPPGLIVIHLTRPTLGTGDELAENRLVTEALCRAALEYRARHVFLMSSAAVYRPSADLIAEDVPADPQSDYGRSKLEAERTAAAMLSGTGAPGLTILRLANLAGADALLGSCIPGRVITLDPITGQAGGPERSYIGPRVLAGVLSRLVALHCSGAPLPNVLNIAQPAVVAMADLLQARGQPWQFGPPRDSAIARLCVATDRLAALMPLPPATPASLIADLDSVQGRWP